MRAGLGGLRLGREGLGELDAEGNLPQLAYHFSEAAPGGDVEKAIEYATRAADRVTSQVAYEEAAAQYERALQALELATSVDEKRRCELLLALGDVAFKAGDPARSRQALDIAVELARRLKDNERLVRAAVALSFNFFEVGKSQEAVVALVEEALSAIGQEDSLLRVRLLISPGRELAFSTAMAQSRALALEAVDVARRLETQRLCQVRYLTCLAPSMNRRRSTWRRWKSDWRWPKKRWNWPNRLTTECWR